MFFSRSKPPTPADALTALTGGELQLVDVREPAELARGSIKGATHIPLGQLQEAGRTGPWPTGRVHLPVGRSQRNGDPRRRQGRV
jgi:rhodanese-related sulfurtransferase